MNAKKPSLRKCIGCFSLKEKKDLLRLYKDDAGEIKLDESSKSGSRGAYICKCGDCVLRAQKKKALEHSFKMRVEQDIYDKLFESVKSYETG